MIVSSSPFPNFRNLIKKNKNTKIDSLYFFSLGRQALLFGLISLGLNKKDSIIIPAYICDSAISPLRDYGFNLVFIDVGKDLNLSINQVQEVITESNAKALLVIHYFGITKNYDKVIDVCYNLNVRVVEDCTHSFLSQLSRNNNIRGDMEIFSIRKTLPVQDGGALRINSDCFIDIKVDRYDCVTFLSTSKYLLKRLTWKVAISLGLNIYGPLVTRLKNNFRRTNKVSQYSVNTEICQPSWQLSQYLNNDQYLERVKLKIEGNFSQLGIEIKKLGFKMLENSVPDRVFPQALAIYDNNGGLLSYLRKNGIGAWCWPGKEMPLKVSENSDIYENSVYFNKKLVLLPIHQGVDDNQCCYMVKILEKWKKEVIEGEGNA